MELINRSSLSKADKKEIFHLWNNEYPEKLSYKSLPDFEVYLQNLTGQSHILLKDENQNIKGWYFDFMRDNQKWFALILDSKLHGKGWGTKMLSLAKDKEKELNGWVIDHNADKKKNGERYLSPLIFYLKNGFRKLDEQRLELNKISAVKINWTK
ncbi:N-acetyltransferase [Salinimicrobium sp. HB62]|uniref:N-acetyltransferase n=1 Tax=Salinimicrobium sp. HB62 TaxID=3077781 RepID=UPI002D799D85|nr:N-acetyltransferase [Salinimicrobium sp. HB62]